MLLWDTLRSEALPRAASLQMMEEVAEDMDHCHDQAVSHTVWRKASYSTSNGGACVEVASSETPWRCAIRRTRMGGGWPLRRSLKGVRPADLNSGAFDLR